MARKVKTAGERGEGRGSSREREGGTAVRPASEGAALVKTGSKDRVNETRREKPRADVGAEFRAHLRRIRKKLSQ